MSSSQPKPLKPSKRVAVRLVRRNEEEDYDDLALSGNNLVRKQGATTDQLDVEIELTDDGEEMQPGAKAVELNKQHGSLGQVITGIVATLLIILVFLKTGVSKETGVTILLAILVYYFGFKSGQRN